MLFFIMVVNVSEEVAVFKIMTVFDNKYTGEGILKSIKSEEADVVKIAVIYDKISTHFTLIVDVE